MSQRYFRHEGDDSGYQQKVEADGHVVKFQGGKVPVSDHVAGILETEDYPNVYEVDEEDERLPDDHQNLEVETDQEEEAVEAEDDSGDEPHTVTGQDEVSEDEEVDIESEEEDTDKETMADDYLDQNASVVRESLRNDDLEDETLEDLLEHEEGNKDRKTVKEEIQNQLEGE